MTNKEDTIALDLIHQLMKYDFGNHLLPDQLAQVDQGFGITYQMIEALAESTDDDKLNSLAQLVRLAWRNYGT